MTDHFTPFADPHYAARRAELRLQSEKDWAEAILSRTRLGVLAVVFAGLFLALSAGLVAKRLPEIARAQMIERPA